MWHYCFVDSDPCTLFAFSQGHNVMHLNNVTKSRLPEREFIFCKYKTPEPAVL